jgi:hypothetical protein
MRTFRDKSFLLLLGILLIKAFAMSALIRYGGLGLAPDEAQYWTWSQNLDWGYYSKPPGIALEIWLGTRIFGNTVLGVRIGAVALSFVISLAVYVLSLVSGLERRTAFWAGIISSLTPMGFFASYYATTDAGLALFWTLACIPLAAAAREGRTPNYLLIGMIIALGAIFKWPIYLIWGLVLLGSVMFPAFRSRSILAGAAVSLLGLLSPLIWNASRGWPTFHHVWSTMNGGHGAGASRALLKGNFFDFMGAQAGLLSPILFICLLISFAPLFRRRSLIPPALRLFGMTSFLILAAYQSFSLFQKMQGNWCVYIYPMIIVYLAWFLIEYLTHGRKWLYSGLGFSLFIAGFVFSLTAVQTKGVLPAMPLPQKLNRLNECLGWENIADPIVQAGYLPEQHFLFSDRYQGASLLSFYAPGQKRAYFFNHWQRRQNQFSYWPTLADEQLGRTGYFAVFEEYPLKHRTEEQAIAQFEEALKPYFKTIRFVGIIPLLRMYGKPCKAMILYRCEEYNGLLPEGVDLY